MQGKYPGSWQEEIRQYFFFPEQPRGPFLASRVKSIDRTRPSDHFHSNDLSFRR